MDNLQQLLREEFGRKTIENIVLPSCLGSGLSPNKPLRPYQEECFRYFLTYMDPDKCFEGKLQRPHLLFHMATGSGKTLVMAGAMLCLYKMGYRNFIFFVSHTNILEKTKDNFLNAASPKYLFAQNIMVDGKPVEIREVKNFQGVDEDCINLCLTTIQGLHSDLHAEKENSLTYEDFSYSPVVLISDEAHHMNAATKAGKGKKVDDEVLNWETTVMRIFNQDNGKLPNILLEFTATMDLTNEEIAKKYENKIIFDYPLKKFREDKYSKDVDVIQADLQPLDRALQAMILSQFKRKLFAGIKQNIKPVVLLKSSTIADNKKIFEHFKVALKELSSNRIEEVRMRANGDMQAAFEYFDKHQITDENLILELQADFSEERLLLIDGKNISPEKQQLLNSLEDANNEIRAIFAVDMLNEGWDVLNLFDIVRLYDTRDANKNKPGKTTMQEAQLIGRGARYMPFHDPEDDMLEVGKRKYDGDVNNPLRVIEKLHYHSAHNPRYIQELHKAMVQTGIVADKTQELHFEFKKEFKDKDTYRKGLVFANERKPLPLLDKDGTLRDEMSQKVFTVKMPTGKMKTGLLFGDTSGAEVLTTQTVFIHMKDLGEHVVRTAMNTIPIYAYSSLHILYPKLKSCREFVVSSDYLSDVSVKIVGRYQTIGEYSQRDKLYIAQTVLQELEPLLSKRGISYKGTKLFKPKPFCKVFRDNITLHVSLTESGDKEFGVSQKMPKNQKYACDLMKEDWYPYTDNFGTSEEKALVLYIRSIMPRLNEKYEEVYLVRNESDLKLYDFDEGRPFEPDFLLFMRRKGRVSSSSTEGKFDHLQIFIEPKGNGLLAKDKWKENFLKRLRGEGKIEWLTVNNQYNIWGMPFYNESQENIFASSIEEGFLEKEEGVSDADYRIIGTDEIADNLKFKTFLPVYSVKAACGSFDDEVGAVEAEPEGWVDVSSFHIKPRIGMFAVYAVGDSMLPKIKNGQLCVFEQYGNDIAGSREGEIVLTQCLGMDTDYECSYTIKKYHSLKTASEDGMVSRSLIELQSLNPAYPSLLLDESNGNQFKTIGILKAVI